MERPSGPGCPFCLSKIFGGFDWRRVNEDPKDDFERTCIENLEFARDLKYGRLYRCRIKGCLWHLDVDGSRMDLIDSKVADQLLEWNHRELLPSPEQMLMLERIGASGSDSY